MQREQFDIFISGAGLSGLIAACAFGAKGFSVLCVDPTPPITNVKSGDADRRSTAFLQPARTTLEAAGIWPRLAPFAAPLEIMRLADAGGVAGEIRHVADFVAGISRLKIVKAHAVMQPMDKYAAEAGPIPDSAPLVNEDASLSELIQLAIDSDAPIVVQDNGQRAGVITRADILQTVIEGAETS